MVQRRVGRFRKCGWREWNQYEFGAGNTVPRLAGHSLLLDEPVGLAVHNHVGAVICAMRL